MKKYFICLIGLLLSLYSDAKDYSTKDYSTKDHYQTIGKEYDSFSFYSDSKKLDWSIKRVVEE